MATVRVYANGLTMGTPGGAPPRFQRGSIQGWSADAARRQRNWLYSIETAALDGIGYAVTLTLRNCPTTADEWAAARRAWIERMRRSGSIRGHWVTEMQARLVPHMHVAVYWPKPLEMRGYEALLAWLEIVKDRGWEANLRSQDVKIIDGVTGWLEYLSKHAGRSVAHYQRQGMPAGWEKSGRLWGKWGVWPANEPIEAQGLTSAQAVRYRRLVDAYVLAKAKQRGDQRRAAFLRRRRRLEVDPYRSRVLGVSEWVPESVALRLLDLAVE